MQLYLLDLLDYQTKVTMKVEEYTNGKLINSYDIADASDESKIISADELRKKIDEVQQMIAKFNAQNYIDKK